MKGRHPRMWLRCHPSSATQLIPSRGLAVAVWKAQVGQPVDLSISECISRCMLPILKRDRDGNVPVSFIQKYLMKKLDLASEAEVEIRCMGRPVIPTLLLYNLVDQWLQTVPKTEQVPVTAGFSAKDYVMVLAYARKVPNQ
ncbi:hypothetical protein NC653_005443 [Populus alba x Populus x berolinensis]|uniref:Uncharacterized protein n=1 Tax=Populus alba x Populus x berolinensis TaxID=444605 RepID=A0AAD6WB07_9ROSI|nr:hypothetical protein NC653_005443 [Populus alba x Populus x berolinensis]